MKKIILLMFLSANLFAQYNVWEWAGGVAFYEIYDVVADKSDLVYAVTDSVFATSRSYGIPWEYYEFDTPEFKSGLYVDNSGRLVSVNSDLFGYYDFENETVIVIDEGNYYARDVAIYHDNVMLYNQNGYQFSTDFGETWSMKNYLSGKREFKLINSTCYIAYEDTIKAYDMLSDELLFSKSINGEKIYHIYQDDDTLYTTHLNNDIYETKDLFETTDLLGNHYANMIQKNPYGDLFIQCGDVFRLNRETGEWESQNIPWLDTKFRQLDFSGNIPLYLYDNRIFMQTGSEPNIPDNIYVPLSVGNKYRYHVSYSELDEYKTYKVITITDSRIINGKEYFKFSNNDDWVRYDKNTHCYYKFEENKDILIADFTFQEYGSFYTPLIPGMAQIVFDTEVLGEDTLTCKSFQSDVSGFELYRFAEGIGFVYHLKYDEVKNHNGSVGVLNETLLDVEIIQEDGTSLIYTSSKPKVNISQIEFKEEFIRLTFSAEHPYDTENKMFTKTAKLDYYFNIGDSVSNNFTLSLDTLFHGDNYFIIPLPEFQNSSNITLNFTITVTDDNFQPVNGYFPEEGYISVILTGMDGNDITNIDYSLEYNYPNPFNPTTTISYSIKEAGRVLLEVYDILGAKVTTLVNEEKSTGKYEVKFNASGYSSGMYFYKITSGEFTDVKKMILMK